MAAGKDLVESERRFAVMRLAFGALCCWIIAPLTAILWHFLQEEVVFLVGAALAVVVGIVCTVKCWFVGSDRTPCACESETSRAI